MRNRRLLLILLLAGGFAGGSGTVFTFLPIYLREELKFSTVSLGLYLSLAQVAGIGSQPLMGYLSDRVGRKAVLVPSMVILGSALIGLYLVSPGWLFVVVVIVMGAFLPLVSILLAAAMDLVGSEVRGTVVSLVFGASVALSGLSPLAAGFLADAYGVKATFLWASGIVLATALLAVVTRWQPSEA